MMQNTRIHYMYRDAGNWKKSGSFVVSGACSPAQAQAFSAALDGDGFFVPAAVGVPMLAPYGDAWCDDDHAYHSIETIEPTDAPADADITVPALLAEFQRANWEKAAADAVPEGIYA